MHNDFFYFRLGVHVQGEGGGTFAAVTFPAISADFAV